MDPTLRFNHSIRPEPADPELLFLLSEAGHSLFQGKAYASIAPFLNGKHNDDEIVDQLEDKVPAVEVYYALNNLLQKGYLKEGACGLAPASAAYWELQNADPAAAAARRARSAIRLTLLGQGTGRPFRSILAASGIAVSSKADIDIILTDDYLREELDGINRIALNNRRPWLLAKPEGIILWLGPLFMPGRTGCWECLASRLRSHRRIEAFIAARTGGYPIGLPDAHITASLHAAHGLLAAEVAKWLAAGLSSLEGTVFTLDMRNFSLEKHVLIRRPQCHACGDPGFMRKQQENPFVIRSRKKGFTVGGGHRTVSDRETLDAMEQHISPITGIAGHLNESTPKFFGENMVASFTADHNLINMNDDLFFLKESLRGRSGGKGRDKVQAKAGAICESIERYSGVFHGDESLIRAPMADLKDNAIHPNTVMLYSHRQLVKPSRGNRLIFSYKWVPEPFDIAHEVDWSPLWSLTSKKIRYLPAALCYYGYARKCNVSFGRADSNGCAAGRNREEAFLQGFMELAERDAVGIWWFNRLPMPGVDFDSFKNPYFHEIRQIYRAIGREIWALDVTNDLGIPAMAALSRRTDSRHEHIIFGFGAHFDPEVALTRAITEVNQLLPAVFTGKRNQLVPSRFSEEKDPMTWWKQATISNQPYLLPDASQPLKTSADYPKLWSDDFKKDIELCVKIVGTLGMETLVLDQTRPDTGCAVVKVVVPGLRHFWPRFAPGRLYDVPVKRGWLKKPRLEEEMNPYLIFF